MLADAWKASKGSPKKLLIVETPGEGAKGWGEKTEGRPRLSMAGLL